jgi:5-methylcytosine-specific restriction endonuclease McrA
MTVFSDEVRDAVVARAGERCEYCHLSTRGQVATFPIDHIVPRSGGGETILENLALACPHCNAHKWAHATATENSTPRPYTRVANRLRERRAGLERNVKK